MQDKKSLQDQEKRKRQSPKGYKPHATRIGAVFRDILAKTGWTMKELGQAIGCSESYVSRIIQGTRIPRSVVVLMRLSQVTGRHLDIILDSISQDLVEAVRYRFTEEEKQE